MLSDINVDCYYQACRPTFPLQILVEAPSLQEIEAQNLVRTIQHALDDLNDFSPHHLRLSLASSPVVSSSFATGSPSEPNYTSQKGSVQVQASENNALTVRLVPQNGAAIARAHLQAQSAILDVFYPPSQIPAASSTSSLLTSFIATQLQKLFAEEQATIAYTLMSNSALVNSHQPPTLVGPSSQTPHPPTSTSKDYRSGLSRSLSPELTARLASRITRSLKYAPTYHITISLFSSNSRPSSWDIDDAIEEYLKPLLDSVATISNFTVDSQIQLYASFSPSVQQPRHEPEIGAWTLREEDLSGFVNAAEWPLSPSIGAGPTLNFIVYVPDQSKTPLVVKGSRTTSWLIPQWGGVVILNPSTDQPLAGSIQSHLSKEALRPALLTFSHQLLSFLGAPQSPASIPLQLHTLTRVRAASLLLSASSTMGSLARLTVALPSIAIPETVSTAVDMTLSHLHKTCHALKEGNFKEALNNARIAETAAEKGFFEKSMVGQVYFPDEHKVAVYLPLLGPVGVPLIMSALKEARKIWSTSQLQWTIK